MSKVISIFRSTFLAVLLLPVLSALPAAQAQNGDVIQIREDVPDTYVVVRGDTLWDISAHFLENPFLWPRVWRVNPQIENPDLIYPGDRISLRYDGSGQPFLELERGQTADRTDLPVIRLSPRVRREALSGSVGQIALDRISSLLNESRIVDEGALDNAAYILGTESGALLSGRGDIIYARGDWDQDIDTYEVVRPRQMYTLPETGEEIGVELNRVGEASIMSLDGDVATMRITGSRQEIRKNDKLLPREADMIRRNFNPSVPVFRVSGSILGFEDGRSIGGANDTIVMDVGSDQGVEVGSLLRLQRPSREVRDDVADEDVTIAGKKFGRVLVYRVFDRASMGLVLESDAQIRMTDEVSSD